MIELLNNESTGINGKLVIAWHATIRGLRGRKGQQLFYGQRPKGRNGQQKTSPDHHFADFPGSAENGL